MGIQSSIHPVIISLASPHTTVSSCSDTFQHPSSTIWQICGWLVLNHQPVAQSLGSKFRQYMKYETSILTFTLFKQLYIYNVICSKGTIVISISLPPIINQFITKQLICWYRTLGCWSTHILLVAMVWLPETRHMI